MNSTLLEELEELNTHYSEAIRRAVKADDSERAEKLASAYGRAASRLVAEREGLAHRPQRKEPRLGSPLRRLARRLTPSAAA